MEQIGLLSRREKEVTTLLLQGKSNKQIALSLGVSERTVEFHLKNIYTKLQVSSRVELILKLGKTTGGIIEKLGESTVDVLDKSIHNGKQSILNRWTQPLKNIIFTAQKEFAMMKIIISEDVRNFIKMYINTKRVLFWTPRVLCILFAAFLSMFALDVFREAYGFGETIIALLIHLVPTILVGIVLAIAWRRDWVGMILFTVLAPFHHGDGSEASAK